MKQMQWFRLYSEARTDAKLRSLPDDQFRVWFNLLCYAADQDDERGSVDISDPFIVALEVAGGDEELLSRTCHALSRLRIVTCEDERVTFINFTIRQYDKPSDAPEQTRERKRKQRATMRDSGENEPVSRDVTPSHAERREEKNREEQIKPASSEPVRAESQPFDALVALCEATNADVSELSASVRSRQCSKAKQLLAAGMTVSDIKRCAGYCASQSWRTSPIDMFTIEKERSKWELAGKPAQATANGRATTKPSALDTSMASVDAVFGATHDDVFETTGVVRS